MRVVTPEKLSDGSGSIVFCSPGQTKTISIAQAFNTPQYCNWNNNYEWQVPSGWNIVPSNQSTPYVSFPWGISTKAHSVNITAPSSLAQGFNGNYSVTVRTGSDWYWPPKEITKPIWIGPYNTGLGITGTAGVCPGNIYTYFVNPPGGFQLPGHTYQWTKPANWTVQAQGQNQITFYVPQYNPNYGAIQVSVNNGCGVSTDGITAYPGYGCYTYSFAVSPNPSTSLLTVELVETVSGAEADSELIETSSTQISNKLNEFRIELRNETGRVIMNQKSKNEILTVNTESFPSGNYILKIYFNNQIIDKHIVIN